MGKDDPDSEFSSDVSLVEGQNQFPGFKVLNE